MLRIAIGPQIPLPSWNWVGFELARELSKHFNIEVFTWHESPPACDVLIAVKFLHPRVLEAAKVIYLPVDNYVSKSALELDAPLLARCAAIGCHCETLMPLFGRYCRRVFFLDHHGKFALPELAPYKEQGFVLWVGAFEHVPYLLAWCQRHPLPLPLVLLSNFRHPVSWNQAVLLARQLGVPLRLSRTRLNGHPLHPWFEVPQRQLMQEAKAAIDIKGGAWLGPEYWHQENKPPTKGQQFVCSGIPFAINNDSYCYTYFQSRGLNLATPDDPDRWLSRDYWEETKRFAEHFRAQLSLEQIGQILREQIENLHP